MKHLGKQKNKKTWIRSAWCIGVAIALLLGSLWGNPQHYEAESTKPVVRVGIYEMDGFHYWDDNGELQGYCIDYLERLAVFAGWQYEYVKIADFTEGLSKLEAKEIDLLAPAMYTAEREEKYDFCKLSFGTEYTILVTLDSTEDVYYEDYKTLDGKKVAVLENYPLTEYFIDYMEANEFESELVYFTSIEESKEALKNREVYAIVTSIMDMEEGQKMLARFAPQPFYFLTWNENPEFLSLLNRAMAKVQNTFPTILEELLVEYYPAYDLQNFTREEAEFAASAGSLRVGYITDARPLSFTDENGEFAGISRELFDVIGELAGLTFEYVPLPEQEITHGYLAENKIDLVTGVEYSRTNQNLGGILLTIPYLYSQKMIVSHEDFKYNPEDNYKIAIASGSQTSALILEGRYPNMEVVTYPNNESCFDALAKDEVDMLIQNQYVVEAILSKPMYSDFIMAPLEGLDDELCFASIISLRGSEGMTEAEGLLLITLLNKAISLLDEDEADSIIIRQALANQYELTLGDFVYNYRALLMVAFVALVFMVLFILNVVRTKQRQEAQKEEELRKKDLEQKRYRTIMDCSDDLIYEISLTGDSNIGSDKIKAKFGWEIPARVDDLDFGKAMEILHVHPDDETAFRKTMLHSEPNKADELTVRVGKSDGTYIWCEITRTVLMDENNNVVSILGKIEDVDDEVQQRRALEVSSRTDALTGLLNKITFKHEVKDYLETDSAENVGFVFLDMDHFKEINDTYGHRIGDVVIKEAAKKIQLIFANFDLVARFGGDEFCIFVKDIPRKTFVDKLSYAVERMREDVPYEDQIIHLSASIGAAYCHRKDASYRELFEMADRAVYRAKDYGRDCYVVEDLE